jgi:hypothetical protein
MELDSVVRKAADKRAKDDAKRGIVEPDGPTLEPASQTGHVAHEDEDVESQVDGHDDEDGDED